ncbi:MAG: YkvA family protein [Phormidesmis sp.]
MKKQPFSNAFHDLYRKALKHTKYRWVVILGTLLYLVSPLDISPDVFPVLGWIDDGIVVSLLISEVSQLMTEQRKRKHFSANRQSDTDFNEGVETDSGKTITVEAVQVS